MRKAELEATQHTIKFFETLLRASTDGIVITDSTQNIVVVNEAFCTFFGRRQREVIETNLFVWLEQLNANAPQRWVELEQHVRTEGACYDIEFQMTTKNEMKYLSVNASLLERVAREEVGVIISIWRDITAYKLVEEELRGYQEHLKERTAELVKINKQLTKEIGERKQTEKTLAEMALFAKMNPAPILRTDLNGTILLANQATNKLFENRPLIGTSWYVLCPAVDRQDFDQLLYQKGTLQHEYQIGERFFLFTYLGNVDYGLVHIYGTEITHLKHLEEQLLQSQKMEAVGQLAGGIAHDFNTLLGIILGYGDMMKDDISEDSLLWKNLEEIIAAAYRARGLVNQILEFARPSEKARHPIRLASIVENSIWLLRSSLPAIIGIRQRIETSSSLVLANSTQIAQVIMNLGINAGDALGEQGGEIGITLEEVEIDAELAGLEAVKQGAYVRLSINDTGCGMSKEILKRIFEPFFTTKDVGKGSGLGLSVVHGIVKSHKGFIRVESEPGKGSTFQVYLPRIDD